MSAAGTARGGRRNWQLLGARGMTGIHIFFLALQVLLGKGAVTGNCWAKGEWLGFIFFLGAAG